MRPNATQLDWIGAHEQPLGRHRVVRWTCSFHPLAFELVNAGGVFLIVRTRIAWHDAIQQSMTVVSYTTSRYRKSDAEVLWLALLAGMAR
ncbi:hypothetical protein ACFXJ8_25870 [Nonomuraea sp. NPDC059194]|uniref:hypothetical protein n=1 Tax=Nonomuraea sp. NPDC059194 TaxID=3346764 RepID=UPI0036CBC1C2